MFSDWTIQKGGLVIWENEEYISVDNGWITLFPVRDELKNLIDTVYKFDMYYIASLTDTYIEITTRKDGANKYVFKIRGAINKIWYEVYYGTTLLSQTSEDIDLSYTWLSFMVRVHTIGDNVQLLIFRKINNSYEPKLYYLDTIFKWKGPGLTYFSAYGGDISFDNLQIIGTDDLEYKIYSVDAVYPNKLAFTGGDRTIYIYGKNFMNKNVPCFGITGYDKGQNTIVHSPGLIETEAPDPLYSNGKFTDINILYGNKDEQFHNIFLKEAIGLTVPISNESIEDTITFNQELEGMPPIEKSIFSGLIFDQYVERNFYGAGDSENLITFLSECSGEKV